ncbi:MAG: MBL fold metallo-hydrolase [Candidatus Woesearchaeota archaeon]
MDLPVDISWLGHASFRIKGEKTIYIDPYKIGNEEKADLILITHDHFDHYSEEDIAKISGPDTEIIGPKGGTVIGPNERLERQGVTIETVPAYNLDKKFHPKENNWVGYIITVNNTRIYHAGDTDRIPEMEGIKADIVMVPIGGTYTMDAEEAAEAVNLIKPEYAIPMHYGSVVGRKSDADEFEELCECKVKRFD